MKRYFFTVPFVVVGLSAALLAQSNIDNTIPNKYGWGENVGWTNWRGEATPGQGAIVGNFVMSGYVWGENIGWINLGDGTPTSPPFYANATGLDFGVNVASSGNLSGMAWGENVGWINFGGGAMATPAQPARILCASPPGQLLARLTGFVWAENIGWINLSDLTAGKYVAVDAATTPLACDVNHDNLKNGRDVQSFVNVLLAGGTWRDTCSGAVQAAPDKVVNLADIPPFIACLLN